MPLQPNINGLHAVLDLPSTKAVINPANYVFYVASTWTHELYPLMRALLIWMQSTDIMAQCTKFNPPESLRPHERILAFDEDLMTTASCIDDPLLAGFGDCPGVKASNSFAVVPSITSGSWGTSTTPTDAPPTA